MLKAIINIHDIEKLANDKTIKTNAILQKLVSKIVSLDLPNTDEALSENGIADRASLIDELRFKLQQNAKQGYFGYLIIESKELNEVADSDNQWWLIDAYERVNKLSVPDVEAFADDLGLLRKH